MATGLWMSCGSVIIDLLCVLVWPQGLVILPLDQFLRKGFLRN